MYRHFRWNEPEEGMPPTWVYGYAVLVVNQRRKPNNLPLALIST